MHPTTIASRSLPPTILAQVRASSGYTSLPDPLLASLPLAGLVGPGGLLLAWCTNSPRCSLTHLPHSPPSHLFPPPPSTPTTQAPAGPAGVLQEVGPRAGGHLVLGEGDQVGGRGG